MVAGVEASGGEARVVSEVEGREGGDGRAVRPRFLWVRIGGERVQGVSRFGFRLEKNKIQSVNTRAYYHSPFLCGVDGRERWSEWAFKATTEADRTATTTRAATTRGGLDDRR